MPEPTPEQRIGQLERELELARLLTPAAAEPTRRPSTDLFGALAAATPRFVQEGGLGKGEELKRAPAAPDIGWSTKVEHRPITPAFPEATSTTTQEVNTSSDSTHPFKVVPNDEGSVDIIAGLIEATEPTVYGSPISTQSYIPSLGEHKLFFRVYVGVDEDDLFRYKILEAVTVPDEDLGDLEPDELAGYKMIWDDESDRDTGYFLVPLAKLDTTAPEDEDSPNSVSVTAQYINDNIKAIAIVGFKVYPL